MEAEDVEENIDFSPTEQVHEESNEFHAESDLNQPSQDLPKIVETSNLNASDSSDEPVENVKNQRHPMSSSVSVVVSQTRSYSSKNQHFNKRGIRYSGYKTHTNYLDSNLYSPVTRYKSKFNN